MTTAHSSPAEQLALSRERLRKAMTHTSTKSSSGDTSGHKSGNLGLLDVLKLALPSAALVLDAASQWLQGHPLKANGNFAKEVADELLLPLAKRHPLTLVASAVAVGALLVWVRPWRWALRPRLLNTWGPAVLSSAIASNAVQEVLKAVLAKIAVYKPSSAPR